MPSLDVEEKKTVVDPEGISQHVETYNYIDEEELKGIQGDVDIGVVALQGQDLHFTEEGKLEFNNNQHIHVRDLTIVEKHKVLRKIDWHIMPLAAWSCGLQFVDKVNPSSQDTDVRESLYLQSGLGAAATYGLRKDLHLVGNQYSWCVSVCNPAQEVSCLIFNLYPDVLLWLSGWYLLFWTCSAALSLRKGHWHLLLSLGMHFTRLFWSQELRNLDRSEVSPRVKQFLLGRMYLEYH